MDWRAIFTGEHLSSETNMAINSRKAFKTSVAAGVLLAMSMTVVPASIAGNWQSYVQQGFGVARRVAGAASSTRQENGQPPAGPNYTPPPPPAYTPPPAAPVYTPPPPQERVHAEIRNSTITPPGPPPNYSNPYQSRRAYSDTHPAYPPERPVAPAYHPRGVAHYVRPPLKHAQPQSPQQAPQPAIVTIPPDHNPVVIPPKDNPPAKRQPEAVSGKFDVAWVNNSMFRIMKKLQNSA